MYKPLGEIRYFFVFFSCVSIANFFYCNIQIKSNFRCGNVATDVLLQWSFNYLITFQQACVYQVLGN